MQFCRQHWLLLRQLPCKFGEVWLITAKVIIEIGVKFDWVLLKVIHLDVNSDVNSCMENGWELTSELTSKWVTFNNTQSNFTPISLITFAVINHSSPNLQGSCRNTSRWCLQNYVENGWELTSELTSKWITFNNSQSNFTPSSLIAYAIINQTSPNSHGNCRNKSQCCLQNCMENGWELTSELTSKWITFNNTQSNFTPISIITFAVINQTSPNLQGSCRNKSQCCLQNCMENGWELTSELTSKWVTFNNTQSNFTPISIITFAVIN